MAVDWAHWEPWAALWEHWLKTREREIGLEHIQFIDLYNFFVRQAKALGGEVIDFIDVSAVIDPTLTYEENKRILSEVLRVPPTEKDYESMYEGYKAALESEVKEKYPEVVQEWEKRVQQLEKETELLPKVERERGKFKRLSEELARELEETKRRAVQEREGLEKKVAPVKLRILRGFKEGIIEYSAGSIVETRDIEWAIEKIEKGFAERVGVEPIVKPLEEVFKAPKKVEWTRELERELRDIFETTLRGGLSEEGLPGLSPDRFIPEFRLELDAIKTLETQAEMERVIEKLAEALIRRESRPPPAAPPLPSGWKKVEKGYLTENGMFVPEEEFPKLVPPAPSWEEWKAGRVRVEEEWVGPHIIRLEEWIREALHMDMTQFDELPIEQIKSYVEQYKEYVRRRVG
jgi:hypothetical protein